MCCREMRASASRHRQHRPPVTVFVDRIFEDGAPVRITFDFNLHAQPLHSLLKLLHVLRSNAFLYGGEYAEDGRIIPFQTFDFLNAKER